MQKFPWENITLAESTYKFYLKSKISAEEFYLVKYENKSAPCKIEGFIPIYNVAPSFTKLKEMLYEALHFELKDTPFYFITTEILYDYKPFDCQKIGVFNTGTNKYKLPDGWIQKIEEFTIIGETELHYIERLQKSSEG